MFKHIMVPTDGTELSERAAASAVELARALGARITGLYVTVPFHVFTLDGVVVSDDEDEYERDAKARADAHLAVVSAAAEKAGVPCEVLSVPGDHPYEEIIRTATASGCDGIFMASHGRRGVAALLLGSETTKVLTHTDIPVIVYR